MAKKATEQTDRDRGRRDGFDGYDPREDGYEYGEGYAEGQQQRDEAHERMDETVRRFGRYGRES